MEREKFAAVALLLGGGAVFLIGARSLAAPQAAVQPFGIVLSGPSALSEIRASFGGMHLGVGSFILAGIFVTSLRRAALLLLLLYMAGLAVGRLVSATLDGAPSLLVWLLLGAELVFATFAAAGLAVKGPPRAARSRHPSS
jgi:hypothetical protein